MSRQGQTRALHGLGKRLSKLAHGVPLQDDSLNNSLNESILMNSHQHEEHLQARLLEHEHTLHESAIRDQLRLVESLAVAKCREDAERKRC